MADPTRGERGPQGAHGQVGDTGGTGDTGRQGETGERGRTGAAGSAPLSRTKTLAMCVFVVAAFVMLAYRTEVNFNRTEVNSDTNKDDTWRACTQTNRTALAVNEILDQLIAFQGNAPPTLTPKKERQRDAKYMALKIIPLECPRPS